MKEGGDTFIKDGVGSVGEKPGRPEKLSGEGVNKKLKRLWKIFFAKKFLFEEGVSDVF